MKKKLLSFAICILATLVWSCNNSGSSTSSTDSTTSSTMGADSSSTTTNANTTMSNTPLSKDDSSFVTEAAAGSMMEVQTGQMAQQQASNPRVKDFGNMMVTDHGKANDELKNLVSGRSITLPQSLPSDKQKKVDQLKGLNGSAFDKKYVSMMLEDHQKDVAKFKSEADKAQDPQLKQWVQNTVPVLQKHLDSIEAIKKGM